MDSHEAAICLFVFEIRQHFMSVPQPPTYPGHSADWLSFCEKQHPSVDLDTVSRFCGSKQDVSDVECIFSGNVAHKDSCVESVCVCVSGDVNRLGRVLRC